MQLRIERDFASYRAGDVVEVANEKLARRYLESGRASRPGDPPRKPERQPDRAPAPPAPVAPVVPPGAAGGGDPNSETSDA